MVVSSGIYEFHISDGNSKCLKIPTGTIAEGLRVGSYLSTFRLKRLGGVASKVTWIIHMFVTLLLTTRLLSNKVMQISEV